MAIYCDNERCPRASWCKRFTYKRLAEVNPMAAANEGSKLKVETFMCTASKGWEYYVKNKARQLYEREHPEGEEYVTIKPL